MTETVRRSFFIALLCTLLVSMQQDAFVHPLSHIAGHSKETAVGNAHVTTPCLECSLLAGGSDMTQARTTAFAPAIPPSNIAFRAYQPRFGEVLAWFHSRAPPALL